MFASLLLWAEGERQQVDPLQMCLTQPLMIPIVLIFLFYFMVIRPADQRRQAERLQMLTNLEKNDNILTASGIYATVLSVDEKEDEMWVRLGEDIKVKMQKTSVVRNLTREKKIKEAAEAAKETSK